MPPSQPDSEPYIRIPGSNFYHDTGAAESPSPSSMSGSQERLPQPVYQMIAQVTDELKNATYRVDLTAEGAILHADPNIVKAVIDHLESRHKLTHGTLKLPPGTANPRSKSSATDPRLPSDGFEDEDDSYEPLVHLLNKVIDAANQCMSASHLSGLRFHHFGNEVKGRYGFAKGLKPDGVGIIGELPTGTENSELSWEVIEVIVECFRDLVRHVVGMLSFKGEAAYGLDTTRTQNMFSINNRYYEIVCPIYMRGSPRGRSTVVHSLSAYTNEPPPP
ncbi:hypothetical protein F5888DRAFT_206999 [Russula emetica]|nr:hypothetical protein F5888DRAFT_206999 [Russula emetica]